MHRILKTIGKFYPEDSGFIWHDSQAPLKPKPLKELQESMYFLAQRTFNNFCDPVEAAGVRTSITDVLLAVDPHEPLFVEYVCFMNYETGMSAFAGVIYLAETSAPVITHHELKLLN